jgi:hypothetical protein
MAYTAYLLPYRIDINRITLNPDIDPFRNVFNSTIIVKDGPYSSMRRSAPSLDIAAEYGYAHLRLTCPVDNDMVPSIVTASKLQILGSFPRFAKLGSVAQDLNFEVEASELRTTRFGGKLKSSLTLLVELFGALSSSKATPGD